MERTFSVRTVCSFVCELSQSRSGPLTVDTGFLLVMLCIRPFATTSENEKKVESKRILKISRLELFLQSFNEMENEVYKMLNEWKLDNIKDKFKGKEIYIL